MMAPRTKPISFAEFGDRFVAFAVTPEVVAHNLQQIVPREQTLRINAPVAVLIDAKTALGEVEQACGDDPERELAFTVPMHTRLDLQIDFMLVHERYEALAETQLQLTARAFAPLRIQVDCAPATPDQIRVSSASRGNWLDIAKRVGGLDEAIREQVAAMINKQIEESRTERTIDVRKLIRLALEMTGRLEQPDSRPGRRAALAAHPSGD